MLFEKVVEVEERVTIADCIGDVPRPLDAMLEDGLVRGVSGDVVRVVQKLGRSSYGVA